MRLIFAFSFSASAFLCCAVALASALPGALIDGAPKVDSNLVTSGGRLISNGQLKAPLGAFLSPPGSFVTALMRHLPTLLGPDVLAGNRKATHWADRQDSATSTPACVLIPANVKLYRIRLESIISWQKPLSVPKYIVWANGFRLRPVFAPVHEDLVNSTTYYTCKSARDADLTQISHDNASDYRMDYRSGLRIIWSVSSTAFSHFPSKQ